MPMRLEAPGLPLRRLDLPIPRPAAGQRVGEQGRAQHLDRTAVRHGEAAAGEETEAACARAEQLRSYRFRTVEHILKSQQDRLPLDEPPARPPVDHDNLRGAAYYEETYADPSHD